MPTKTLKLKLALLSLCLKIEVESLQTMNVLENIIKKRAGPGLWSKRNSARTTKLM